MVADLHVLEHQPLRKKTAVTWDGKASVQIPADWFFTSYVNLAMINPPATEELDIVLFLRETDLTTDTYLDTYIDEMGLLRDTFVFDNGIEGFLLTDKENLENLYILENDEYQAWLFKIRTITKPGTRKISFW